MIYQGPLTIPQIVQILDRHDIGYHLAQDRIFADDGTDLTGFDIPALGRYVNSTY